ncbi:MAG: ABC transporter substrate-binding protein [Lachnospiraceae bacterium]|nr:ABC transporter substrate-binding protein [Lachnospiraceae bacterium]
MKRFEKLIGKAIATGIAALSVFSIAACDTANNNANTTANSEPKKDITFVLDWTPNTNHTGLYVALNKGYYEEAGLNVSIVQPPEDGATTMVASGQAQFGVDFQDYLVPVFTSEEKIPVEVCAAILQHNTSAIISLKEDGIESPKDLEGKNYATWDLPIEKAMIQNIMEADGGDYSKLNLIPEYVENEAAALQQDIDAVWVYYAWGGIACKQAGLDTNLIFFNDITPEFDYYSPVIIVNSDWANANKETAIAFLEATGRGYEFAASHPDEAADILCAEVPELDKTLVKESQEWISKEYISDARRWGEIDQKRWDAFFKWLSDNGLADEIPEGYGFTNEYLEWPER